MKQNAVPATESVSVAYLYYVLKQNDDLPKARVPSPSTIVEEDAGSEAARRSGKSPRPGSQYYFVLQRSEPETAARPSLRGHWTTGAGIPTRLLPRSC